MANPFCSMSRVRADTRSAQRLGEGRAMDLSEDGQFAITQSASDATKLTLVPVNASPAQPIDGHSISYRWVKFFPDAKEILFAGKYPKQHAGIYRQRLPNGNPILVKADLQLETAIIDKAGNTAVGCDGIQVRVLNLSNGDVRSVVTSRCVSPVVFVDAQTVLTRYQDSKSVEIELLNLMTGKTTPYHRYKPTDLTGGEPLFRLYLAKDLQTFVYSRMQTLSDLFVVSGWN
jgi:hypothetical protein